MLVFPAGLCDAGKYYNRNEGECTSCPEKTFKPADQKFGACQPCPDVRYTTDGLEATSAAQCDTRMYSFTCVNESHILTIKLLINRKCRLLF